jgi:hypothetical protein
VRFDCRVEGRRDDPFVLGQQVVRILVEVGNPTNPRRGGQKVVALARYSAQEIGVLGVAPLEQVAGMIVVARLDLPILREVVDSHHLMPVVEKLADHVAGDETG